MMENKKWNLVFKSLLKSICPLTGILYFFSYSSTGFSQGFNTNFQYATRMWYTKPAINWNEALPIGNGRMGAMIYGGITTEHISLNEQTLWSGAPTNGNNLKAKIYLPLVRKAALEGDYKKADSLSKFMQGPYTESYMPMADLDINYHNISDSSSYVRELDIDSALAKVKFGNKAKEFSRLLSLLSLVK